MRMSHLSRIDDKMSSLYRLPFISSYRQRDDFVHLLFAEIDNEMSFDILHLPWTIMSYNCHNEVFRPSDYLQSVAFRSS